MWVLGKSVAWRGVAWRIRRMEEGNTVYIMHMLMKGRKDLPGRIRRFVRAAAAIRGFGLFDASASLRRGLSFVRAMVL